MLEFQCPKCRKSFNNDEELEEHRLNHSESVAYAPGCSISTPVVIKAKNSSCEKSSEKSVSEASQNISNVKKKMSYCILCQKDFLDQQSLNKQLDYFHTEKLSCT